MRIKDGQQSTVVFRRLASGNMIGEIIDSGGNIVSKKDFGDITDREINNVIAAFQEIYPDVVVLSDIEVAGN